jgi:hypothetical protein
MALSKNDRSCAPSPRVSAGLLPPWDVGELPQPPKIGWRTGLALVGPGIVLAGTSIGSGEWLFGPAVTAQYGASLLWLALVSILLQAFCNFMMVRYTIYSGEPIIVGGLRTRPGPKFWLVCFAALDLAAIWPYNAANAAVPLAAAFLGRLPETPSDLQWVKTLGFAIFLLAFVPLVFGGTVYRMLEKVMTAKLVLVLGYLTVIAVCMVSWPVFADVAAGFMRFGTLPVRADTIEVGGGRFRVEMRDGDVTIAAAGRVEGHHIWVPERLSVRDGAGSREYLRLDDVPGEYRSRLENLLANEGVQHVKAWDYVREHGRLPPLDWPMIVAFIGIAGAGGMSNTLFSNYARDKGWGMGKHVGAIPSAIGGRSIGLSHTGRVFPLDEPNPAKWRGWIVHIGRDQLIWIAASVVGMALPCLISLEFIRNAKVSGDQVAALAAEGIAGRYPGFGSVFWFLTLLCGFLILAPGQVSVADQIARRWTDMIWSTSAAARRLGSGDVRRVYYGILALYCVWGIVILWRFPALAIAKYGVILQNVALGVVSLQAWYVNRTLMPRELRPRWFIQVGAVAGGLFFLGISASLLLWL